MSLTQQVTPGVYPGPGKASLLRPNEQQYLFQSQAITAGQASIAVQLGRIQDAYPWGVSFELSFSGTPGTFEVDFQTSDTDVDTNFVTINSLTNTNLNTSNVARLELPVFWAKYVRAKVVTLPNAVNTTILATR